MKDRCRNFLTIYCLFITVFISSITHALDTHVTLQADATISPLNSELITFGLPIAKGQVFDVGEIKVMLGTTELPAYVEAGLIYHWLDNSIRSITVQIDNIDMRDGNINLRITNQGSDVERVVERSHSEGWASAGADKNNLPFPRIFALHDNEYLARSGLTSPYAIATSSETVFEDFRLSQFDDWAGGLDFSKSSKANWLFDRATAMFTSYLATGRVEFLKEAFLSKQFYFSYVRNDGSPPSSSGGSGCWTYDTVACADGKYIAPQQAKLAWALLGDDSQWDETLIVNMALQADLGNYQPSTRDEFDSENKAFTERAAGLVGLAEINVFEMTGNATVLSHLIERIDALKDMQQTEKQWDSDYGWTPKSGAWTHNIDVHEGNVSASSAPTGESNARGFSPWMSENIVDFLWQSYWITGNSDIPDMLRNMSNALDLYGFTSSYNEALGEYDRLPEYDRVKAHSCNSTNEDSELLYFASAHADASKRTDSEWWPWYTDSHNIQSVLTLAAGYYFETDELRRARLQSRIEVLIEGWANASCATISATPRLWNWQHRSNSVRTWHWIADENNSGGIAENSLPILDIPDVPASPDIPMAPVDPVVVFVATADCKEGSDPHWQCVGRWTTYDSVVPNDYIAVCVGAEATEYTQCMNNDQYMLFSDVGTQDGLFVCVDGITLGLGRLGGCNNADWVFTENLVGPLGSGEEVVDMPEVPVNPDIPTEPIAEVAVFIATADCKEGNDPHWQCVGRWMTYDSVAPNDYIAVCVGAEATEYTQCMNNDQYMLFSDVGTQDGLFVCVDGITLGLGRLGGCNNADWVFTANFGGVTNGGDSVGDVDDTGDAGDVDGDPTGGISFLNVTTTAIDLAPHVQNHFWAGLPDLNGDGCFDLFVGAHSDAYDSAMYLHDNTSGTCEGTFTYLPNSDNYSQSSPPMPRITSRYMFGNWYNHPEGLWSYYGHDVDGSPAARYTLSPLSAYGDKPFYLAKQNGCYYSRSSCLPLDVTGDGDIELVIKGFIHTSPLSRQIVDAIDGRVEYLSDGDREGDYGSSYMVFDVNNNGFPEIISTHSGGYFSYSALTDSWSWVTDVFISPLDSDTYYSSGNNHGVALDYDNDGDLDVWSGRGVFSADGKMVFTLSRNNGDGTFTDVSEIAGLASLGISNESYWTTYGNSVVADLNLDGYPDILIGAEGYAQNITVLMNRGDGTFSVDRTVDFGRSHVDDIGKAWFNVADYNNDGLIDIVKTHDRIGDTHASIGLFKNTTATDNHWLRVRARGFGENTDGLHTRITLLAPGTSTIIGHYQVGAFSVGYQNLVTHAGTGSAATVDLLIEYPHGGPAYMFENVASDQDVIVFYDGGIVEGYIPGQPIPLSADQAQVGPD